MGYRWLRIGATSDHKTVLIDAVHSGTVHSGTACCAGRDPYLNMTVHLVSGGSMSAYTRPPSVSSCHSKPAAQHMITASIVHGVVVASDVPSCVCGGKE